ncbi:MAG: bifunctional DNA primase/polymerase [Acidimicrobiales bacterium]
MIGRFLGLALPLAEREPVFPLAPFDKIPAIPSAHPKGDPLRGKCHGECGRLGHGFYDASQDRAVIDEMARLAPDGNVGSPTGITYDVLDIDSPEALAALDAAMPKADNPDDDPFIIGPTIRTPRDGWHVRVAPTGMGNATTYGGLKNVDWRGIGGYAAQPGSVRRDGSWTVFLPGDPLYGLGADIRPAPAWLLDLHKPAGKPPGPGSGPQAPAGDLYGQRALEGELGRLASATPGERNHTLVRAAFRLRQLINDRKLDQRLAVDRLVQVARQIGLDDDEIERTIESGFRGADQKSPRRRVA